MDDLQARTFLTVARTGSFAGCADELFMTRSSIKRQIDALEAEVGVRLFDRTQQGVVLTEAGQAFHDGLVPLATGYQDLLRRVRRAESRLVIRIAHGPIMTLDSLTKTIQAYTLRHPHASIELRSLPDSRLVSAIKSGEADACVFYLTEEAAASGLSLWRMPSFPQACCYVSAKSPLAARDRLEPEDLKGRRVQCRHDFMPGVVKALAQAGIECGDAHLDESGFAEIISFVQGGGVHIMTGGFADLLGCMEIPLNIEDVGRAGGVLTRPDPPEHVKEFVRLMGAIAD